MNGARTPEPAAKLDHTGHRPATKTANVMIIASMLVMSAAAGVAAHLHAAVAGHLSIMFATAVFCVLLSVHLLSQRPAPAPRHRPASRQRPAPSIASVTHPSAEQPAHTKPAAASASPVPATVNRNQSPARSEPASSFDPLAVQPDFSDQLAAALGAETAEPAGTPAGPARAPQLQGSETAPARPRGDREQLMELSKVRPTRHPAPELAPLDKRPELKIQPSRAEIEPPHSPTLTMPPRVHASTNPAPELHTAAPAAAPVQNIEGILRRMAAQIRNGQPDDQDNVSPADARQASAMAPPADDAAPSPEPEAAPENPRQAINAAVDALKAAADEMRAQIKDPAQTKSPSIHSRLEEVAEAVSRDQLDIYLNPIMAMEDGKARHFEVTVMARTALGDTFDPEEFRGLTRGSGLMPLLDSSRLRHSSAIAQRLGARIDGASVFSTLEGETLESRRFFASVTSDRSAGHLTSTQLVLSLRQADVRTFAPAHFQALKILREMGFRFALQDVTDLDINFEALATIGFTFVKLDASLFLDGMNISGEILQASEICQYLESMGLTIVIGEITSDEQRTSIAGAGVAFGQGSVFGAPSLIRKATMQQAAVEVA